MLNAGNDYDCRNRRSRRGRCHDDQAPLGVDGPSGHDQANGQGDNYDSTAKAFLGHAVLSVRAGLVAFGTPSAMKLEVTPSKAMSSGDRYRAQRDRPSYALGSR